MCQAELGKFAVAIRIALGPLEILIAMTTRLPEFANRQLLRGDEQFEPGSQETRLHHQGLKRLL